MARFFVGLPLEGAVFLRLDIVAGALREKFYCATRRGRSVEKPSCFIAGQVAAREIIWSAGSSRHRRWANPHTTDCSTPHAQLDTAHLTLLHASVVHTLLPFPLSVILQAKNKPQCARSADKLAGSQGPEYHGHVADACAEDKALRLAGCKQPPMISVSIDLTVLQH